MSIASIVLIVFVFFTFFNTGVQAYIDRGVYPLFGLVGAQEQSSYLKGFEQSLTLPLMLPFLLTLISNIALFFLLAAKISWLFLALPLLLTLATAIVSIAVATPIYNRYKQGGENASRELATLQRVNLLRLFLSILTSLIVAVLLAQVLSL